MKRFILAAALAAVGLSGCGGGGGGSGTSVSVSPRSFNFTVHQGDNGTAPQIAHVSVVGDGLVIGYPPGVPSANWLSIVLDSANGHNADYQLYITDTSVLGGQSTTLRFVTGRVDRNGNVSQITYADVAVHLMVQPAPNLSITTSPDSLSFEAPAGTTPASQNVVATFDGDTAAVESEPWWLTVTSASDPNASPATFQAVPNTSSLSSGTVLTGDLVLRTSLGNNTNGKTVTVPVTYTVYAPFDATGSAMPYTAVHGSSEAPQPYGGYIVSITGDHAQWRATTNQPWVKLSQASGSGPGSVTVTADATGVAVGAYSAAITITDDASGQSRGFNASLQVRAPKLVVAPASATFTIDSAATSSALTQPLSVSDEVGGTSAADAVSWSLQSVSADWVSWSPASGTTSPSATASLTLDTTKLKALPAGVYTAQVNLIYSNADGSNQAKTVPVTLDLRLPYVQYVAPYVGIANKAGSLTLRGTRFDDAPSGTVLVGTTEVTPVARDSATQWRISYPALAAGTYPVQLKNAAGITRTDASLVVVTPPTVTATTFENPGRRARLLWDAERATLYAVSQGDAEIERYVLGSGGGWTAAPVSVPNVMDLDLFPNGRSLLVATRGYLNDVDLSGGAFTLTPRVAVRFSCNGHDYFRQVAMLNNGHAPAIGSDTSCSGWGGNWVYDIVTHALLDLPGPAADTIYSQNYGGTLAGSADGTRAFLGWSGVSPPQPIYAIEAAGAQTRLANTSASYDSSSIAVSGDGSRVLFNQTDVTDKTGALLGKIPAGATVLSHDGARAFSYRDDNNLPRVIIYNLATTLPDGTYPVSQTVLLSAAANGVAEYYTPMKLTSSPDDKILFVSGDSRILVVPLP